jgi:Holliday junction DNA helicase RuvA
MIVRLTGSLIEIGEETVVLERDGLAREVLVPRYALGELAACRGREVMVHTLEFYEGNQASGHLTPRLIGFLHLEDKAFFQRFISVKGIGPRKALKALAEPTGRIARWIQDRDGKSLAKLPGIGKRAAELIVAELQGKLDDLALGGQAEAEVVELSHDQRDALEILVAWGDSRADAQRWLERAGQLHTDVTGPDEWVRLAYRVKTGMEG